MGVIVIVDGAHAPGHLNLGEFLPIQCKSLELWKDRGKENSCTFTAPWKNCGKSALRLSGRQLKTGRNFFCDQNFPVRTHPRLALPVSLFRPSFLGKMELKRLKGRRRAANPPLLLLKRKAQRGPGPATVSFPFQTSRSWGVAASTSTRATCTSGRSFRAAGASCGSSPSTGTDGGRRRCRDIPARSCRAPQISGQRSP